jgi:hypothetical protein
MMKSLTPKPIKLPAQLERCFNDPPLVGNERPEDYRAYLLGIAADVEPVGFIQWINVKEYADNSWELQRERRIKTEIIKLKQKEAQNPSGMAMLRVRPETLGRIAEFSEHEAD